MFCACQAKSKAVGNTEHCFLFCFDYQDAIIKKKSKYILALCILAIMAKGRLTRVQGWQGN